MPRPPALLGTWLTLLPHPLPNVGAPHAIWGDLASSLFLIPLPFLFLFLFLRLLLFLSLCLFIRLLLNRFPRLCLCLRLRLCLCSGHNSTLPILLPPPDPTA